LTRVSLSVRINGIRRTLLACADSMNTCWKAKCIFKYFVTNFKEKNKCVTFEGEE